MDAPVRQFLQRLEAAIAAGPNPDAIAGALSELASDRDYFASVIAPIDENTTNGAVLHVPERGPRLFLMHRPRGVMGYVHSHGTWAAVAPVKGVETHRRYDVVAEHADGDRAELIVTDERRLRPGEAAVIVPPNDIHSHGHAGGDDETPYTLIVTGDDQLRFARREYDLAAGIYRELPPGDFGTLDLPPVR